MITYYNSKSEFLDSMSRKSHIYIIRLNQSMFTRYSIWRNKEGLFRVRSHVDEKTSTYTEEELFNEENTNFLKALEMNAVGRIK